MDYSKLKKGSAIVVEDQAVIWDYARACLEPYFEVKAFCSSTFEAECAFREFKPDLVWLDCYLGEISETGHGVKNSGIQLATWIKKHEPKTKIFLFTASNEISIVSFANELGIEGMALGGKFLRSQDIVKSGIKTLAYGGKWISPTMFEDMELDNLENITAFEFCVVFSLLLGKQTNQIADEFDTTRKRVNNAIYRVKQKLGIDEDTSREEFLEMFKDEINNSLKPSHYHNLSELVSVNAVMENYLGPVVEKFKAGELNKVKLGSMLK